MGLSGSYLSGRSPVWPTLKSQHFSYILLESSLGNMILHVHKSGQAESLSEICWDLSCPPVLVIKLTAHGI